RHNPPPPRAANDSAEQVRGLIERRWTALNSMSENWLHVPKSEFAYLGVNRWAEKRVSDAINGCFGVCNFHARSVNLTPGLRSVGFGAAFFNHLVTQQ